VREEQIARLADLSNEEIAQQFFIYDRNSEIPFQEYKEKARHPFEVRNTLRFG